MVVGGTWLWIALPSFTLSCLREGGGGGGGTWLWIALPSFTLSFLRRGTGDDVLLPYVAMFSSCLV